MSDPTEVSTTGQPAPAAPGQKAMPAWFVAGILGVFIGGGGGMLLAMYGYDYRRKEIKTPDGAQLDAISAGMPAPGPGAPAPGMGMGGGGMGMGMGGGGMGGGPGMGGGGMGMGMGGPGMGGGPSGKRDLTAFVGKVELLSRPNIQLTLDAEQQAKLAAELQALEKAETMTDEDAQKRLETLQALFTPEQNDALEAVALPRRGRGGGAGPGGPGGPGAAPPADENPFAQEANQKRLHDLLSRVQPSAEEQAVAKP